MVEDVGWRMKGGRLAAGNTNCSDDSSKARRKPNLAWQSSSESPNAFHAHPAYKCQAAQSAKG